MDAGAYAKFGVVFTAAFLAGFVSFGASPPASALERRVSALTCEDWESVIRIVGTGIYNTHSLTAWAHCFVPSEDDFAHDDVRHVNIHGYDSNSSAVSVRACASFYGSNSSSCGPYDSSTGSGVNYTIELTGVASGQELYDWGGRSGAGADFPYLDVQLPGTASFTTVRGFWLSTVP